MRRLTLKEQRKILVTLAADRFGADMMLADTVMYGGQLEEYRDAKNYIDRVIKAFPLDIRQAYDAETRKIQADRLRRQADEIEKGKK